MQKKKKNRKILTVVFDKELEKLQNVVLFPEKLEMANQFLKKYGLPKEIMEKRNEKKKQ